VKPLDRAPHTTPPTPEDRRRLLCRGFALEYITLGWYVIGLCVLPVAAFEAHSVAPAGFGLESLIEIGASTVLLWELAETNVHRQHDALRLIAWVFLLLALFISVQSTVGLVRGNHATEPRVSPVAAHDVGFDECQPTSRVGAG
jgi:hypothetical protein